jgi:xanthine dehydrogenase accessory factor
MSDSTWSVPESTVYSRARDLLDADDRGVLATVIDVEGNAYRRPGAKMLVVPDGEGVGSVTAGCLEDDIRRLAEDVLAAGEPRVETYDMMEDDDDVWGLGVGCNGVIDVLLEPLTDTYCPALNALDAGDTLGMVTVVDGDPPMGTRAYYRPGDGFTDEGDAPAWLRSAVESELRACLDRDRSGVVNVTTDEGTATVFLDAFTPPPKLVLVGSGHDVGPVVELAGNVDFRTHVVGYRGTTATADRFPAADVVRSTSPAQLRDVETFDENTYVVVMTHNFVDDRLTLEALLETPAPYIGLMGPRERFKELLDAMADDETAPTPSDEDFDRIYTPIGLDLGSGTPYGIAHSIVAELLAVANNRDPKHLSAREGPIHERVEAE